MSWPSISQAATIDVIPRTAWQARPPTGPCKPHTISSISIHHTATETRDNTRSPARLQSYQRYHQDNKGWTDLAYHLFVDLDGHVYAGRNHACVGDTSTNYDPQGHLLIVLEGNFEVQKVRADAFETLAELVIWAVETFNVKPENIKTHRDLAATACPGQNLFRKIQAELPGRMAQIRAKKGPLSLEVLNGSDAYILLGKIKTDAR